MAFVFMGDGLRDAARPRGCDEQAAPVPGREPLLAVKDLRMWFHTDAGVVTAVDGVTFAVQAGEVFGIVGESGSGKSVTAMTILGLIPTPPGRIESGSILWKGEDLLTMSEERLREGEGARRSR